MNLVRRNHPLNRNKRNELHAEIKRSFQLLNTQMWEVYGVNTRKVISFLPSNLDASIAWRYAFRSYTGWCWRIMWYSRKKCRSGTECKLGVRQVIEGLKPGSKAQTKNGKLTFSGLHCLHLYNGHPTSFLLEML